MITLTREEAERVLDALVRIRWSAGERDKKNRVRDFDAAMDVSVEAIEILRARLAEPVKPAGEWVGLTGRDEQECLYAGHEHGWRGVMLATAKKLKEKNG